MLKTDMRIQCFTASVPAIVFYDQAEQRNLERYFSFEQDVKELLSKINYAISLHWTKNTIWDGCGKDVIKEEWGLNGFFIDRPKLITEYKENDNG
jgi:hypothetical protein